MIRRVLPIAFCLLLGVIMDITIAFVHFTLDPEFLVVRQYGWPFATMQVEGEGPFWMELLIDRTNEKRYSATHLMVNGVANTLFYALLLWLLFFAPGSARRILRRRRGLCEKCAYPIGVSPVCTECGAAVRARVAR